MAWFMGIDIGSATSKGVITKDNDFFAYHVLPSGTNYRTAAQKLREDLLAKGNLSQEEIACTVATGRGANNVLFADRQVADIICCARGISSIFPSVRTVIDVEDQSSQVIRVDEEGRVINFTVSERCAAGSGRFLQVIANVLRIDPKDIGPLSLKSENPVIFTTGCAVFGETEAVSRVAEGTSKEDILGGVHKALAGKISTLAERLGSEEQYAISGGGGLDIGLIKAVEKKLDIQLLVPPHPQLVTALGAVIIAAEKCESYRAADIGTSSQS